MDKLEGPSLWSLWKTFEAELSTGICTSVDSVRKKLEPRLKLELSSIIGRVKLELNF